MARHPPRHSLHRFRSVGSREAAYHASRMTFELFGAQNDQFVEEALDCENAFELFMQVMNDP